MKNFIQSLALSAFLIAGSILQAEDVTLKFPDNQMTDLLAIYSKLTGKTIIASHATYSESIVLVTAAPVSKNDAITLIEETLEVNGFRVENGAGDKSLKILPVTQQTKPFRHAVFFKFKEGTTDEEISEIEQAFVGLKRKISTIVDFEWGTSESVEGLNDDFSHCFFVTFKDKAGLEFYIPHPDHVAFVELLKPKLEKPFVFDYTPK